MNPFDMSADDLRVRLGDVPFEWLAYRDAYRSSVHHVVTITDLGGERPFTVYDAIAYGEREAARLL